MSGPSGHNFDNAQDPNYAGALRKALSGTKIGKPESVGGTYIFGIRYLLSAQLRIAKYGILAGRFHTTGKETVQYAQFNTHSPPDITGSTRVIAVLGVHDDPAPGGSDGWFLSDFFAFWNIFQGMTKSQTWYHCLDLDDLVATHDRYLHGNPHGQRKVVLDADILAQAKKARHSPQHINPDRLKQEAKRIINSECEAAELANEAVLILIFGHGDKDNYGIELGKGQRPTLKIHDFKSATKNFKVGITMITTSCYSGGWNCNPQLNISTMTAAGNDVVSLSWLHSGSTGPACGSMFTSALVQKLTRAGADSKSLIDGDDDDADYTEDQETSYAEFTRTVHERLLKDIDRRGYEHGLTFGDHDDAWSMCWGERTGIPLGRFKERWDKLEDWAKDAALHPGDAIDRDPSVTEEQLADYMKLRVEAKGKGKDVATATESGAYGATGSALGKRKTRGLYGGTDRGLIGMVSKIGAEYLNSYPGGVDTADDGWLHHMVEWIQSGRETDMDIVEKVLNELHYRMTQMSFADKYLEMMEIAAPDGQSCCEHDTRRIRKEVEEGKRLTMKRLIFDREVLFPRPVEGQGRPFYKGVDYLIAAFHHADTSKDVVIKKLDTLIATLDQNLEEETEMAKRDPEVCSKRRKLFRSFGLASDNMSRSSISVGAEDFD